MPLRDKPEPETVYALEHNLGFEYELLTEVGLAVDVARNRLAQRAKAFIPGRRPRHVKNGRFVPSDDNQSDTAITAAYAHKAQQVRSSGPAVDEQVKRVKDNAAWTYLN